MPCTTILVGKKASHDGSTIIARNDDGGFEAKRVLVHPAKAQPRKKGQPRRLHHHRPE